MIELVFDEVTVNAGGARLLDRVSLRLAEGEFLALVGPNGAGKTTLLKTGLGLLRPSFGRVSLSGSLLSALTPRERARRLAYLPQNVALLEPLPVRELVACARYPFGEPHREALDQAERALAEIGAAALAERRVTQLSGGERQRVLLACLLAQDTPLLLLDEPANHLDPAQQIEVYRLLDRLWQRGKGVLSVTHDVNLLRHLSKPEMVRIAGIESGHVAFESGYHASELPDHLTALFGVGMRVLEDGGARILIAERVAP